MSNMKHFAGAVLVGLMLFTNSLFAHIVMAVPVGQKIEGLESPLEMPSTYRDLMGLVTANYRHRFTKLNYPSVTANRAWLSTDRKSVIIGRMRRILIEGRTVLKFPTEDRAEQFFEMFNQAISANLYLVFDSHKAEGFFFPRVHEEDLWVALRHHDTSLAEYMVPLTQFMNKHYGCEGRLSSPSQAGVE